MNTKLISEGALAVINQYENVPYYNNKTKARRAGLRVDVGKGSPKEIFDELNDIALINKINVKELDSAATKKMLVDNNIGIECSGFVYYVLNEESISRGKGTLDKYLKFPYAKGILGKIRSKFRPIINTNVKTLAHDNNSKYVLIKEIEVGDIITMTDGPEGGERDHVLVIYQIEYQNFTPVTLHYAHSVAWPTDGEYGTGLHKGIIEITDTNKSISEQRWIELDKTGEENYTHSRALKSKTEVRRLRWFN